MRKSLNYLLMAVAGGALAFAAVSSASATTYNASLASPGVYYGSGNANPNSGFTVDTSTGAELGLGVHYRYSGPRVFPSSTNIYNVSTGFYDYSGHPDSCTGACAKWNFDFSVNLRPGGASSNSNVLSDYSYQLSMSDTHGHVYSTNPLSGDITDSEGWDGSKNVALTNVGTDWGFQNSENLSWFAPWFNPLSNGTYTVTLSLLNSSGTTTFGSVTAVINATPIPATLPLFLSGIGLLGFFMYRRKKGTGLLPMTAA